MNDAIRRKAIPGGVVMVTKDGKTLHEKSYGFYTYDSLQEVSTSSLYDVASLTKVFSTTLAIMKLYDDGKIDLRKKISHYLPELQNSNKGNIPIKQILLHHGGLAPSIAFYKETINSDGPSKEIYSTAKTKDFSIEVAPGMYLRNDWKDTVFKRMKDSRLRKNPFSYSDNSFIFLGEIIERISGKPLDQYVYENFYVPLGLNSTMFRPLEKTDRNRIVPTEHDKNFRRQVLQGYVHDPGAGLLGGVAGHAGLFSTAGNLSVIMHMLLNNGTWNGRCYIDEKTVKLFTQYHNDTRRGLGFDKPDPENESRKEPYPTESASPLTFGHTGYTGTCAWADPVNNLVFIVLTNRVYPDGRNLFMKMNIRPKLHEVSYRLLENIQ